MTALGIAILLLSCLSVPAFAPAAAPLAGATQRSAAPASKHPQQQQHPCSLLCWARRQLGEQNNWGGLRPRFDDWNRTDARRATQGSAYANSEGPDSSDEPGPPFSAYSTEATSLGPPGGAYYNEDGDQALALDAQLGVWGGQNVWPSAKGQQSAGGGRRKFPPTFRRQNPQHLSNAEDGDGDNTTRIGHFTLEFGDQRGMQALSGTYEGARAASGSHTAFNLATRDSIGGSVFANNNDAYGPTSGRPALALARNGETRSVAFTDLPANSAAQSGTGYGVEAAAAGWEVAATARSGRDSPLPDDPRATLGHRPPGQNGLLDAVSSRGLRKMLQDWPSAQGPGQAGRPATVCASVSMLLGAARYRLLQLWVPRWSRPVSHLAGAESLAPRQA